MSGYATVLDRLTEVEKRLTEIEGRLREVEAVLAPQAEWGRVALDRIEDLWKVLEEQGIRIPKYPAAGDAR